MLKEIVSTHSRPKAAERNRPSKAAPKNVSTHSRPKAADFIVEEYGAAVLIVSTHSRPKAADIRPDAQPLKFNVSTHSRPKAADAASVSTANENRSFNTQPPEGG